MTVAAAITRWSPAGQGAGDEIGEADVLVENVAVVAEHAVTDERAQKSGFSTAANLRKHLSRAVIPAPRRTGARSRTGAPFQDGRAS